MLRPCVQWVVYDGKTEAEVDAEWAEGGECNAVDLTEEMDEARTVAEALCAPATLSWGRGGREPLWLRIAQFEAIG